ncbi:MAG: hypothetical protein ABI672_17310 [Vicinamibacteria bacterium]
MTETAKITLSIRRPAQRGRYDSGFAAFKDAYSRNRGWFARRNAPSPRAS